MKTPKPLPAPQFDFQDSAALRESQRSLGTLVREAAARLRKARSDSDAARLVQGFGKGNGERFQTSRY